MNRHAHRSCRLPDASQAGSVPDSSASQINKFVAKDISAMVNNPRFVEAIQAKIGTAVDTEDIEKQIAVDRKSTRLNSSHNNQSRMPSSA